MFVKPEYLYRPSLLLRRPRGPVVTLPWGLTISVNPREDIGRAVCRTGVYDLAATEALWRLTDPGETAFDIGANVGYMSALLAARGARVYAFEPHPAVFGRLEENARRWPNVQLFNFALSDLDGPRRLSDPPADNEGAARVSEEGPHEVTCRRLDSLDLPAPRVVKLDVEGHELEALRGAGELIGTVRDIVFEEHSTYPTPVTDLLEAAGHTVFDLGVSLFGPVLSDAARPPRRRAWEPRNMLATLDPLRARERFDGRGWRCLRRRRAPGSI